MTRLYPLFDANGPQGPDIINIHSLMTPDTTPATSSQPPASAADLTVPDAVNALLDEASVDNGPYSALFTATSVQLVETATRALVREVQWPQAGEFSANLLRAVLPSASQPNDTQLELPFHEAAA